jgi:hypothetical protein
MENQQNGKSENEENHYTSNSIPTEENGATIPVDDDGLGETVDQGEEDDNSGGLAGNAAGNTAAEDQ